MLSSKSTSLADVEQPTSSNCVENIIVDGVCAIETYDLIATMFSRRPVVRIPWSSDGASDICDFGEVTSATESFSFFCIPRDA